MRILSNYISTLHNTSMMRKNQDLSGTTTSDNSKNNYDEITIRSKSQDKVETKFISVVKSKLMNEIMSPTPEEKLDLLKKQMDKGTYHVDPNKIADKILLYKGAELDE